MQRKKQFLLLLSLFFISSNNVYASCTQEEIDNFKKIEDQYKVTYEFDIESKTYTLYLTNPKSDTYAYVIDENMIENISESDDNTLKISNVTPGKYEFGITGINQECYDRLKTFNLNLQKYNKYYGNDLCNGIEEFVLCQPTYDKEIDYETFVSRVNSYKKKLESEEQENKDEIIKEENEIVTYIKDNLLQIISTIAFILTFVTIIILTIKSIQKSRRLE